MIEWTDEDIDIMIANDAKGIGRTLKMVEAEREEYPLIALRSLSGSRQVMRNEYAYHERNGTLESAESVY